MATNNGTNAERTTVYKYNSRMFAQCVLLLGK